MLLLLDFDECVNEMDNNCAQMCQNTNGSYSCECRIGYSLDSNGYTCNGKSTLMSIIMLFYNYMGMLCIEAMIWAVLQISSHKL